MTPELILYQEERPWGYFRKFIENTVSTVKIISVKPNEVLSLQTHSKRSEFWRVIRGEGVFQIGDKKFTAIAGEEYEIPIGEKHRISSGPEGIDVLEIALGEFDEKDIIRLEDKYGRA